MNASRNEGVIVPLDAIQETPEDDNVEVLFFGIQSWKCMLSFSKNSVFLN